jgi:hypothetical protein
MALSQACGLIRLGWEAIGEKQNTHILRTLASSPRQHRPFVPSARARRHGQEVASRLPTQRWCPPRRQATSPCGTLHRHGGGWKHARARAAGSLERCRVSHLPSNAPPLFFTCTRPPTVSRVCCLRRKARVQTPRSVAAAYSDSASASSLCVCSSA